MGRILKKYAALLRDSRKALRHVRAPQICVRLTCVTLAYDQHCAANRVYLERTLKNSILTHHDLPISSLFGNAHNGLQTKPRYT
jgi:hypothetical protein